MKPFKINRNTWHYKLNQKFMNEYGLSEYSMEMNWEPRHRDFCSYWRATIFRVVGLIFLTVVAVMLLVILGFAIYQHPLEVFGVFFIIVSVVAGIIGVVWLSEKIKQRKYSDEPEGLVSQRYRAYKSKICPMVEYEE